MPRKSLRQKALLSAQRSVRVASALLLIAPVFSATRPLDLTSPAFLLFLRARSRLNRIRKSRYVAERVYRKRDDVEKIFEEDLEIHDDGTEWLNDREFLKKYRCSRDAIYAITEKIQGHEVFARGKRGPAQMPVIYQLMTLLHFLGGYSESCSSQRNQFKLSVGRTQCHRDRVVEALSSLHHEYVTWPDSNERKEIAKRIERKFFFPNNVGMMDGTLLPLGMQPSCDDYYNYNGRKFQYSLTVNVINDDKRRIRAYLAGFPGSAHDNRVWKNMQQHRHPNKYFDPHEYVTCDSAYSPDDHTIPAYKCANGYLMHKENHDFNTFLGSPRVICEHTMGLWKGRFPWLRGIMMEITNEPESMEKILKYIDATVVLHNMLIDFGEDDDDINPWSTEDDDMSDIDEQPPEREELDDAVPLGSDAGHRREQLKQYLNDYCVRNIRNLNTYNCDSDESKSSSE